MPTLYVAHKSNPYIIQEPEGAVFRMNSDGTRTLVVDHRHADKILSKHRIITEAEALLMAYAHSSQHAVLSQSHDTDQNLEGIPRRTGSEDTLKLYSIRNVLLATAGIIVLILLFFAGAKGGMATLLEFFLLLMALPALAFGLTFVFVLGFLLYLFIQWIIIRLGQRDSR
jgi:hypothetical protein